MDKKTILLVDDDLRELERMQAILKPHAEEWDIHFAKNGFDACELIENLEVDLIISDLEMPGMDGARLLTEFMHRSPNTIRILSADVSSRKRILHSIGVAHQFLAKSGHPDEIPTTITRALTLRDRIRADVLHEIVSRLGVLPSLPANYSRLVSAISDDNTSLRQISEIIELDLGMSAKILQLVNSAFYGLPQRVVSISQAVVLLGLDVISSLTTWFHLGAQFTNFQASGLQLNHVQQHSLACACYSQAIASKLGFNRDDVDDIFVAGLFHEVGILVLANAQPDKYAKVLTTTPDDFTGFTDAENEIIGTTHTEVGAYLLALWGFRDSVVEACCYNHHPEWQANPTLNPVSIVYLANIFAQRRYAYTNHHMKLKLDYISAIGLEERLPELENICENLMIGENLSAHTYLERNLC